MRRFVRPIILAAILALVAGVAQAQNIPKVCDAECVLRLQQSVSDLQQRVRALEQASEDQLTTESVGRPGPDVSAFTYTPDPSTLTPYVWALSCQHREQTGTVPSERGGTQEITVRRC